MWLGAPRNGEIGAQLKQQYQALGIPARREHPFRANGNTHFGWQAQRSGSSLKVGVDGE